MRASEPLFDALTPIEVSNATGINESIVQAIEGRIAKLNQDRQKTLSDQISALKVSPTFLRQVAGSGDISPWYGTFSARRIVDTWKVDEFKTEAAPTLKGRPKSAFVSSSVVSDSPEGRRVIEEIAARRARMLDSLTTAEQLEKKEAEILFAKAEADRERQRREFVEQAISRATKRLPIAITGRRSMQNDIVLKFENKIREPMTINVMVTRGAQSKRFTLDLAAPQFSKEIGWAEGWGFHPGDEVVVGNPRYDEMRFAVSR